MTIKERIIRSLQKGEHPTASSLHLPLEQYVKIVSEMKEEGLIGGVYISFCDSSAGGSLLDEAYLTEKGQSLVPERKGLWNLFGKR